MAFIFNNVFLNIIAAAGLVFLIIYVYFKQSFKYWATFNIPTTKPIFPYGDVRTVIKQEIQIGGLLANLYHKFKAQGCKHFGYYFFSQPMYVPIDPELIKNILAKDFNYFHDRGFYHNDEEDPMGAHLISLDGLKWKNLRSKLSPAFTSGKMKMMFSRIVENSFVLNEIMAETCKKDEPINFKDLLARFTTDVIGSCAFGLEINSLREPDCEFIRRGNESLQVKSLYDTFIFIFVQAFPELSKKLKLPALKPSVANFFKKISTDNINYREKNGVSRNDFLQLLIQLKNTGRIDPDDENEVVETVPGGSLTMDECAAQTFLFFLAGYETSSSAMSFALYELALNPEVQEKTRSEILKVLEKHNGEINYNSIMDMRYLEMVILESLRKYPPLAFLNRQCTKDYHYEGTVIQKGVRVWIPVLGLHMDPEYYPNPEKFDPERFTEENKLTRPSYTYLAFGEGPRICIGLRFGLLQTKVGLTQLLSKYRFTMHPKSSVPIKVSPAVFVTSAEGGIWLNAEKI